MMPLALFLWLLLNCLSLRFNYPLLQLCGPFFPFLPFNLFYRKTLGVIKMEEKRVLNFNAFFVELLLFWIFCPSTG
jgi:hypothetical protein